MFHWNLWKDISFNDQRPHEVSENLEKARRISHNTTRGRFKRRKDHFRLTTWHHVLGLLRKYCHSCLGGWPSSRGVQYQCTPDLKSDDHWGRGALKSIRRINVGICEAVWSDELLLAYSKSLSFSTIGCTRWMITLFSTTRACRSWRIS